MYSFFILGMIGRAVILGSLIVAMIMIARKVHGGPRRLAFLGFGAVLISEIVGVGVAVGLAAIPAAPTVMLFSVITGFVRTIVQLVAAIGIALIGWAAVSAHRPGSGARV